MPGAVEPGVALAEDEARHGAAGLGLLGGLLDVEAAGLGEVQNDPVAVVEVPHEVLGPAGDVLEAVALQVVGGGGVGLERREAEEVGPAEGRAGEQRVETLGQRLHLGQFGHATM